MSSSCKSHIRGRYFILVLPLCSAKGTGVTPLSCVWPTPWEIGERSSPGTIFKFRSLELVFKVLNHKANSEACQDQFNLHGAAPRDWEPSGRLGPQTCSTEDCLCVHSPCKGWVRGKDEKKVSVSSLPGAGQVLERKQRMLSAGIWRMLRNLWCRYKRMQFIDWIISAESTCTLAWELQEEGTGNSINFQPSQG